MSTLESTPLLALKPSGQGRGGLLKKIIAAYRFQVAFVALCLASVVIFTTQTMHQENMQVNDFTELISAKVIDNTVVHGYNVPQPDYDPTRTRCFDTSRPVLRGMDVISFFDEANEPTKGDSSITSMYGEYSFWFSSNANKEIFEKDPEKYAPAWGAFCAFGIAHEQDIWVAEGLDLGPPFDINTYHIGIDGRSYFFRDSKVRAEFLKNEALSIDMGNSFWAIRANGCKNCFNTYCFCDSTVWPLNCRAPPTYKDLGPGL